MIGQVEILQKRRGGCGARACPARGGAAMMRDCVLACFPLMWASCATARLSQGFKMYGVVTLACVYTVNRVLRTMNEAGTNSISREQNETSTTVLSTTVAQRRS